MMKLQTMMRYFVMLSVLAGAAFLSSCGGDEEPDPPVAIAFSSATSSVSENSGSARTITINFEDFAPEAGTITVNVTNGTGVEASDYTLAPAASGSSITLSVASGEQSATFTVTPVDNDQVDGNKEVTFTLAAADGGLVLGNTTTTHVLTISDDEVPQTVSFAADNATMVMENSEEGTMVSLALSGAVGQASSVTVGVSNNANVTDADYTTDPAVNGGAITISLEEGADMASFMVMPVDNNDLNADERVITFTLTAADGGLGLGDSNLEFMLTIEDDEVAVTNIADIRALYDSENDSLFDQKVIIRGIVTSSNDNLNSRNYFVQDATAGILIRTDGEDNTFVMGDEVEINLEGGTLSDFRGLVQINELPFANAMKVSEGNDLPAPMVITVAQLLSGEFQGMRVQIDNVTFPEADGIATLRGNSDITDNGGTDVSTLRVESGAPFADNPKPLGTGSLIGIASAFNSPQLVPAVASDIFESMPTAEITASTAELESFGDVNTNAMSMAKSYTISATGLTGDITVTAPESFMVSLTEDGTYASEVMVDGSTGTVTNQSIFVKFAPTSGSSQTFEGSIQHTAAGAAAATVSVSGNEVANTNVEPTPISEIRGMYDGENTVDIEEIVVIKGIVTTGVDNINSRNIFLQDATAGIVVRFTGTPEPRFEQGQELEININGAEISNFNDLVQINNVPLASVTVTGTPGLPAPMVITIEQLNSGDFEGMLVEIQNVSFPDADGTVTFADNGRNNTIQDENSNQAVVRVNSGSSFEGTVLPSGTGNMRGVAGVFRGTAQLLPTKAEDIFVE